MSYWSRRVLASLFGIALLSNGALASGPTESRKGLLFIHNSGKHPLEFICKHRMVIGVWVTEKQTSFGLEGSLHYPVRNDRPDLRYVESGIKLITDAKALPRGLVALAENVWKPGYYDLVAVAAERPAWVARRWLPIRRSLDLGSEFFASKEYRYEFAVDRLLQQLDSKDAAERALAAERLGALGSDGREVLPRLAKLMDDPNADVARAAMLAVAMIGADKAAPPRTAPR